MRQAEDCCRTGTTCQVLHAFRCLRCDWAVLSVLLPARLLPPSLTPSLTLSQSMCRLHLNHFRLLIDCRSLLQHLRLQDQLTRSAKSRGVSGAMHTHHIHTAPSTFQHAGRGQSPRCRHPFILQWLRGHCLPAMHLPDPWWPGPLHAALHVHRATQACAELGTFECHTVITPRPLFPEPVQPRTRPRARMHTLTSALRSASTLALGMAKSSPNCRFAMSSFRSPFLFFATGLFAMRARTFNYAQTTIFILYQVYFGVRW